MGEEKQEQPTLTELIETDFLKCKHCNKRYASPVLLPCLHAFCQDCLTTLPQKEVTNGNSRKLVQFQCPLCHSTVTVSKEMSPTPFLQSLCQLHTFKHTSGRTCSYCRFDGKNEAAEALCLDCVDDMCEACTTAHKKTRLTRNHTIAPYNQILNGLFDHDIRNCQEPLCPKHSAPFVNFCRDCEMLTCKTCNAESHRGHSLEQMEAALTRLQPEAKSFVQGLRKRVPTLTEYQAFLKAQLQNLEKTRSEVVEAVKQQAENIHAMVDAHRDVTLAELDKEFSKEEATINGRSKDLDVAKKSLESNAEFLGHLLALGSPPEVLQLHAAIMARLKQLIQMQPNAMTQRLAPSFQPGPASLQNMRIMFGTLDLQRVPINQEEGGPKAKLSISTLLPEPLDPPQLITSIPVKQENDCKEVWPSGLCLRKEKMVVVDRDNKKVKIFDCNSKPAKLTFQFSGKAEHMLKQPFDAVLLENGVVVVTDHEAEKVKIFDVTGKWIGDLEGDFRHPRGIAADNKGQLVVVDGLLLRLTVHDADNGKLVRTIPATDASGNKLLVDPFYVAITEAGHIVVTDHAAPNIKVFSMEGQHLATYGRYGTSASEVLKPYGVCVDRYGQMFVADSDNHRIHLLLPDGTFSKFLLNHRHKVAHPVTLAINSEGHLLVGEAFGKVKVFKYL
ncbi:hypothetical protein BaRGS_00001552 [Batillaria attramentaria]|uniref:Uncharacterized protein n=1 Tax=Batillaria attramentaria TaxID=370345 RepID=A0ABD0M7G0_9CAEN